MIYEKGPQTLSEVIRIVEKFTAAQVTATLKPSLVSMMSNDERCFVCGTDRPFWPPTSLMHSFTGCNEFNHSAQDCPTTFLPQEHHATKTGLIPGNNTPKAKENRSQSTHYRHRHERHFNQSHCWSHHDRSSSSYRRDILCSPSSHHSGLNYPLADRCSHHHSCQDTPHRHSHIPSQHLKHATSPTDITHATLSTFTALHEDHSQWRRSSTPKACHPPWNPPIQDHHHSGLPIRFFLRYRQWLQFFKPLKPSPSSNED